jgi:hypothetical protein
MAPGQLRDKTIKELRKTLLAMMSARWDVALENSPDKEVDEAARALLGVQRTRLRLRNAQLGEIRDQLTAQEGEINAGLKALGKALKNLENVEAMLVATAAVLRTLGRIVKLSV